MVLTYELIYSKINTGDIMQVQMINENTAQIKGVEHFDLTHTFMCGQCFRWFQNDDKSYTGVAHSRAVNLSFDGDILTISNTNQEDVKNIWLDYLDLNRDYSYIKELYSKDKYVSKAMEYGYGIHILNQDIFECLISFIISTQNQIPRIKKIVHSLCEKYGDSIKIGDKELYAFPTVQKLAGVTADELGFLKAGYRAGYIVDAVEKIVNGCVDLDYVKTLPYPDAKAELMKIKGVGPKVADCVLLFSGKKSEAFPIDVWVKRTMQSLYMDETATNKQIEQKAKELFGEYAGFAQQYLFYYARENGGNI